MRALLFTGCAGAAQWGQVRKTAGEGSTVIDAISGRLNELYRQGAPPTDSYFQGAGQ